MILGYIRQSRKDAANFLHEQRAALTTERVAPGHVYEDLPVGRTDRQPNLTKCLQALKCGDTLVIWNLRVLAPNMKRLAFAFDSIIEKGASVRVLEGATGRLALEIAATEQTALIFKALSHFERSRVTKESSERPSLAVKYHRAGRPFRMSAIQLREAAWALKNPKTNVVGLCRELGVSNGTLYKYVTPHGDFRPEAQAIFDADEKLSAKA